METHRFVIRRCYIIDRCLDKCSSLLDFGLSPDQAFSRITEHGQMRGTLYASLIRKRVSNSLYDKF
jgi:hypothetical protein